MARDRTDARWLMFLAGLFLAGLMAGGALAYLACVSTLAPVERCESASDISTNRPPVQPSLRCPAPVPCGPVPKCEPTVVTVREEPSAVDERLEAMDPQRVQAELVEAMQAADIGASFELDCTAYPCFAVFAGEPPSADDRVVAMGDLVESLPDAEWISSTRFGLDGRVTWVVVVAENGLTDADRAAVEARIDELLLPSSR